MSNPKPGELIQCQKCKVPVTIEEGGIRCPSCGEIANNPELESLIIKSWSKHFCDWCGETQPIMPNGKCSNCGRYPSEVLEKIANRVYPAKEETTKVSLRLTITDKRTGQSYDDPALELPGTFDEFMIAFLIWKSRLEKPVVVDPDFLKRAMK